MYPPYIVFANYLFFFCVCRFREKSFQGWWSVKKSYHRPKGKIPTMLSIWKKVSLRCTGFAGMVVVDTADQCWSLEFSITPSSFCIYQVSTTDFLNWWVFRLGGREFKLRLGRDRIIYSDIQLDEILVPKANEEDELSKINSDSHS